jgi:hypothetical protein
MGFLSKRNDVGVYPAPLRVRSGAGFTLVEALLYSAILATFLGFTFISTYGVFASNATLLKRNEIAANEEFIEAKIAWVMGHAGTVLSPDPHTSSAAGFTVITYIEDTDPAVFDLVGGDLRLSLAGGAPSVLNNDKVVVSDFLVEHFSNTQATSSVRVSFTLRDISDGDIFSSPSFLFVLP